jgi:hypothetical protein
MTAPDEGIRPAELFTLAARAMALAEDVRAAQDRLRAAPDEPTRRVGFRIDDVVGYLRQCHDGLRATAEGLTRIGNRGSCPADWGACPDHGATLRSSGGSSWCAVPGCRTWDHDRLGLPCSETATHLVTGPEGSPGRMCRGHAHEAATVPGFHVEPLDPKAAA